VFIECLIVQQRVITVRFNRAFMETSGSISKNYRESDVVVTAEMAIWYQYRSS
jgi:hypothetical protein